MIETIDKQESKPERALKPWPKAAARLALASCALICLLTIFPTLAPAQISLGAAVDLAQRNSSEVKLAEADLSKADAVLAQTKNVYIPNFVIGSNVGPPSIGFPSGQPSIANAAMQSLAFSFSQRQYIRAALTGTQAANLAVRDAKEQVALEVSTAYIELDTVTQEVQACVQQQAFAERLVRIENERTEAGVDPLSEVLQARLTAAQLKLKLLHLESRSSTLASQLASLTGLPAASIRTDHSSIPEIPEIKAGQTRVSTTGTTLGTLAAQAEAASKQFQARGDELATKILPQIAFGAIYNRDATSLNNYNLYFSRKFKADNFSAGFAIQIPIFDLNKRAKARETAAEALRATVEAEQAQRQNDVQIATLSGSLRELDALAEVASLKQQIAVEQLKTVETQLQSGNGAGVEPGAAPQLSPKAEQLARIDERQKFLDTLDAGFDLTKARLTLLRALGHMEDWLNEVRSGVQPKEPVNAKP